MFKHLDLRGAAGVFAFHPKNGSRDMRNRGAGIYSGLGVRAGIPDVIAIKRETVYRPPPEDQYIAMTRTFALELKRASVKPKPGAKRTPTPHEMEQAKCRDQMEACGATTGIAYGLDEALQWLERHDLLKGTASAAKVA